MASSIGIAIGTEPFDKVVERLDDWLDHEMQSIPPGETHAFSHEGEFQVPGRRGLVRLRVEVSGIE
jgi:hypothetical protein